MTGPELPPGTLAALRAARARFALLHGSRAAGTARPDSDVDVAAWWPADPPPAFEVDVPNGVDLLVLNDAPLELAGRVAQHGILVMDDDPPARVRWVATTRTIYAVELPRIQRSHREFLDRARGGGGADPVARLLASVSDDLAVLRAEAGAGPQRRRDPLWSRGIRSVVLTAAEACVDLAQHLCASQGWGPPANNADAVRLLGRHGVLDPALAADVAETVELRSALIYEPLDVDEGAVRARAEDPSEFVAFVAAVTAWQSGTGPGA